MYLMGEWFDSFIVIMLEDFFILIYLHISRNIIKDSIKSMEVWVSGFILIILLIIIAFIGYVLVWGQISLWGATVITNLITVIPIIGESKATWLWGRFSINNPLLKLFYSKHFFLPMLILIGICIHIIFLHLKGSRSFTSNNLIKTQFNNFYIIKDGLIVIIILVSITLIIITPKLFFDCENFIPANFSVSPLHIQPEWYLLKYYAILRSIPNKLGGIIITIIFIKLIFFLKCKNFNYNLNFLWIYKLSNYIFFILIIILIWVGRKPVENPFIILGKYFTFITITYLWFLIVISYLITRFI